MSEIIHGYHGVILEVDLSAKKISRIPLAVEDARSFIGGRGLGMKLLADRLKKPGVNPLSPENPLLFMPGPFSGFPVPSSSRTCIVTKSPRTSPLKSGNPYASTVSYANMENQYKRKVIMGRANCIIRTFTFAMAVALVILTGCNQKGLKQIDVSYSLQIESELLNESRDIFIHLPEGYWRSEKRYPVLYVLDAEDVFSYSVGAVDFLSTARMPEMIVVGIPNTNRDRDLRGGLLEIDGTYIHFEEFLESELIPVIDKAYRTQPYRVLYGFCSGAGTVSYLLFNQPEMFNSYIAAGTGFDESWAEIARKSFARFPSMKKTLFAVTEGTTMRAAGISELREVLVTSAPDGLDWDCQIMEGEEHGPVAARGLFAGLRFIFREWSLPQDVAASGPIAVQEYYENLSLKYGFKIEIPEQPVLNSCISLVWQEMIHEALPTLRFMTEKYPDSPDSWEALGIAWETMGVPDSARLAYENAVVIARKNNDRRIPMYEDYVSNIQKVLEEMKKDK